MSEPRPMTPILMGERAAGQVAAQRGISRHVRQDVAELLSSASREREVITEEHLAPLPAPVRRYLRYSGVVGRTSVNTVYLEQRGSIRPGARLPRLPLEAEQWYTVQPPGFVWTGTVHAGPVPIARGRDRYRNGRGHMLIKAGSLFTIVDARGEAMDQGSMMRYLSEMIWFPTAFLGTNISFQEIDARSALVTLSDSGRRATGTLHFDDDGRLTEFTAKRYAMLGGKTTLEDWSASVIGYGELAGLRLPVRAKAIWHLDAGDLEYIDITVTEVIYDDPGDLPVPPAEEVGSARSSSGT